MNQMILSNATAPDLHYGQKNPQTPTKQKNLTTTWMQFPVEILLLCQEKKLQSCLIQSSGCSGRRQRRTALLPCLSGWELEIGSASYSTNQLGQTLENYSLNLMSVEPRSEAGPRHSNPEYRNANYLIPPSHVSLTVVDLPMENTYIPREGFPGALRLKSCFLAVSTQITSKQYQNKK